MTTSEEAEKATARLKRGNKAPPDGENWHY